MHQEGDLGEDFALMTETLPTRPCCLRGEVVLIIEAFPAKPGSASAGGLEGRFLRLLLPEKK